jgi:poly(A) polymerase Pap1
MFENQNIKKHIKYYKDYQVILSFVKYWAEKRNIYAKAFGFLSGISWSIMVAYFLQKNGLNYEFELEMDLSSKRFSSLLVEFFKFYASFSWLEPVSLIQNLPIPETRTPMMILQSVYPYHNTSKIVDDYRKKLIIKELKRAHEMLTNEPFNYDSLCESPTINSFASKSCLRFEIRFTHQEDLIHISNLIKAKVLGLITNIERSVNNLHVRVYPNLFDYETSELSEKRKLFLVELIESENLNESQKQMIYDYGMNFIRSIKSMSYTCYYEIFLQLC